MIAEDEWLVVIDRQKVFAESEWSAWACADGTYYDTNEAFAKLAKAFGDRVVYTRYVAPIPPKDAWVDYFKDWPQFLVPPDDPMYDLTDDFESSPSYKNLLLELTGLIQTHIELHGIQ